MLVLAVAAACSNAAPIVVKRALDALKHGAGPAQDAELYHRILLATLELAALYALGSTVSLRRAYVVSGLNQSILNGLQLRMYEHVIRLPHAFHNRAKLGDIMLRLTSDVDSVQQALSQLTNKALYQVFLLALGVVALIWGSGFNLLSGLILALIPLFWLSYAGLRTRNKTASREQRKRIADTAIATEQSLSAHAVIKAFGMEEKSIGEFRSRLDAQRASKIRLAMLGALTDLSEDAATALAMLIIVGVGGWLVIYRGEHVGALVAAVLLTKNILGPVASFATVGQTVQQASAAMDRVSELLEEPLIITDQRDSEPLERAVGSIRFESVTFGYEPGRPVLRDLSLDIPAGASIAFVGPSGGGKSTVVSLLMRFWDPDLGRITLDGYDLRDIRVSDLRAQFGIVFQDTIVFDTSVRDNIAVGRPNASETEIVCAAKAARLHDSIMAMPEGYGTVLGERGVRMSGGQRQRLAIARAILREPRILLLDEATSALDADTEAGILETLSGLTQDRTTISVTHRLSWAASADRIYVLDLGELVEEGTHAELLQADGLYRRLYDEQLGRLAPSGAEGVRL